MMLFIDGSVNPKTSIGYGASLVVMESDHLPPQQPQINIKQFFATSSTRLEIQTLLWALKNIDTQDTQDTRLTVFTDSQSLVQLLSRREKLEIQNFISKKGTPLKNRALYIELFKLLDVRPIEIHKIKGHKKKSERNDLDNTFSLVDKASRQANRQNFT